MRRTLSRSKNKNREFTLGKTLLLRSSPANIKKNQCETLCIRQYETLLPCHFNLPRLNRTKSLSSEPATHKVWNKESLNLSLDLPHPHHDFPAPRIPPIPWYLEIQDDVTTPTDHTVHLIFTDVNKHPSCIVDQPPGSLCLRGEEKEDNHRKVEQDLKSLHRRNVKQS